MTAAVVKGTDAPSAPSGRRPARARTRGAAPRPRPQAAPPSGDPPSLDRPLARGTRAWRAARRAACRAGSTMRVDRAAARLRPSAARTPGSPSRAITRPGGASDQESEQRQREQQHQQRDGRQRQELGDAGRAVGRLASPLENVAHAEDSVAEWHGGGVVRSAAVSARHRATRPDRAGMVVQRAEHGKPGGHGLASLRKHSRGPGRCSGRGGRVAALACDLHSPTAVNGQDVAPRNHPRRGRAHGPPRRAVPRRRDRACARVPRPDRPRGSAGGAAGSRRRRRSRLRHARAHP